MMPSLVLARGPVVTGLPPIEVALGIPAFLRAAEVASREGTSTLVRATSGPVALAVRSGLLALSPIGLRLLLVLREVVLA